MSEDGRPLLHQAAENGRFHQVEALLAAGEAVDQGQDFWDCERAEQYTWTALSWASHRGHGEIVRILLEAGANVNHEDRYGRTPLLLNMHYGVPPFSPPLEFSTATFHHLVQAGAELDRPQAINKSPLMEAIARGLTECVEYLVAHGADVNRVCESRIPRSVLGFAFGNRAVAASEGIVRCLVNAGVDVNYEMHNETALEMAIQDGARSAMWILLKAGARVRHDLICRRNADKSPFDKDNTSAWRYYQRIVAAGDYRNLVAIYRCVLTAPLSALSKYVELRFGRAAPPEIVALILEFWKPPGGP